MPKLLPMYGYVWDRNEQKTVYSSAMTLVYSEETKNTIQQYMREDGVADEYTWYKLERIES